MVTLQRPGDTRWGSHYKSISNLIKLFSPTCEVPLKVMDQGNSSQKVEAESAYEVLISFEFVFILHFVNEIIGIIDKLSSLAKPIARHFKCYAFSFIH